MNKETTDSIQLFAAGDGSAGAADEAVQTAGESPAEEKAALSAEHTDMPAQTAADDTGERAETGEAKRREKASRLYTAWMAQAADLRETYPGFELTRELKNADFRELLRSGASVRAAYELVNRDAIMRAAARDMEEKLIRRILSGADRPREGGLTSQSAAVVKSDVAGMSKAARREIIRRVQRGEKISF